MSEHDDWAEINRLEAENARLRAELAAEREKVERLASSADEANVLVNKLFAERYALRSELAAANDMKRRMTDACEEANRVAEQYRAELAAATARLENALNEGAKRRAERDALRAELSAEREKSQKWIAKASEDWPEAINEIDRLRAELAKRDEVMKEAQEKLQPISALVDMTPSGFPDHDICPIRLGMARDLRKLRSRIDAALVNGCSDEKA